ncbi:MAG TPA: DUF6671 family protein [Drouetiella sp.]|jgi:hypothetical protein
MVKQMPVGQASKDQNRYSGRRIVLTTKHKKDKALARPIEVGTGLLVATVNLNTDQLGTFTREINRTDSAVKTAKNKARLGMRKVASKLGLANEGSFGPHPDIPFIPSCYEVIVFIDDELGMEIVESIISAETNFAHIQASSKDDISDFLQRARFPSHGLIVRPNKTDRSFFGKARELITRPAAGGSIFKGIRDKESLAEAVSLSQRLSFDGLAHIETDMRAHMNPTRMRVLRTLGINLARRLCSGCPECETPGFGMTGSEGALRCNECGYPTEFPALEIHSCAKCKFQQKLARKDGRTSVESMHCSQCNP